jgi:hypothetical protein
MGFAVLPRIEIRKNGAIFVLEPDFPDPAISAGHVTGPFSDRTAAENFIRELVRERPHYLIRDHATPAEYIADWIGTKRN